MCSECEKDAKMTHMNVILLLRECTVHRMRWILPMRNWCCKGLRMHEKNRDRIYYLVRVEWGEVGRREWPWIQQIRRRPYFKSDVRQKSVYRKSIQLYCQILIYPRSIRCGRDTENVDLLKRVCWLIVRIGNRFWLFVTKRRW